jgi:hypothetical protein
MKFEEPNFMIGDEVTTYFMKSSEEAEKRLEHKKVIPMNLLI